MKKIPIILLQKQEKLQKNALKIWNFIIFSNILVINWWLSPERENLDHFYTFLPIKYATDLQSNPDKYSVTYLNGRGPGGSVLLDIWNVEKLTKFHLLNSFFYKNLCFCFPQAQKIYLFWQNNSPLKMFTKIHNFSDHLPLPPHWMTMTVWLR